MKPKILTGSQEIALLSSKAVKSLSFSVWSEMGCKRKLGLSPQEEHKRGRGEVVAGSTGQQYPFKKEEKEGCGQIMSIHISVVKTIIWPSHTEFWEM